MDTTSNALSRILYLLAAHPEAQEQLRIYILSVGHKSADFTYEELVLLPFLDAVCRDMTKKCFCFCFCFFRRLHCPLSPLNSYPPVSNALRTYASLISFADFVLGYFNSFVRARKDIVLPLSTPITGLDGREMHEVMVPNNTNIIISITQLQPRSHSLGGSRLVRMETRTIMMVIGSAPSHVDGESHSWSLFQSASCLFLFLSGMCIKQLIVRNKDDVFQEGDGHACKLPYFILLNSFGT